MKFFKKKALLDLFLDPAHRGEFVPAVNDTPEPKVESPAPTPTPLPTPPASASLLKKVPVRHAPALDVPLPSEDTWFRLFSGRSLASIRELYDALGSMSDDVWVHHVNRERNDFANWIEAVFQSGELAEQIRNASTPPALRNILSRYL